MTKTNHEQEPDHIPAERVEVIASQVGRTIASVLPPGVHMALFLFTNRKGKESDNGFMTWVSNVQREDACQALREWLATHPEARKQDDMQVPGALEKRRALIAKQALEGAWDYLIPMEEEDEG